MSELRPVEGDYEPGYPEDLSPEEVRLLLRPSLFQRFASKTLVAGAMLTGAMAATADAQEGNTSRTNKKLKERVDRCVAEVLGELKGKGWNDRASIELATELAGNPPVKYPRIPISFGNSYVGIFDVDRARRATQQLFAAYGIELEQGQKVEGQGYSFAVDGYDPKTRTGFTLMLAPPSEGTRTHQSPPPRPGLDRPQALEAAAADGVRLLVVKGTRYANMDGDQYTPTQYYLASVVDYLNWIHGERRINRNRILGELPGALRRRSWRTPKPLPGCGFEDAADLGHWTLPDPKAALDQTWSAFDESSLRLTVPPQGRLLYTLPGGESWPIEPGGQFSAAFYMEGSEPVNVLVTLKSEDGATWSFERALHPGQTNTVTQALPGKNKTLGDLDTVEIAFANERPVVLYLDELAISRKE